MKTEELIFNRYIMNETFVEYNGQTVTAADYYPVWLNSLADDVTLEGSLIIGFVEGSESVRSVVTAIRKFYEHQEFSFAGPFNDNLFVENYTGWINGEPISCIVEVIRDADGQVHHMAASYRPLNAVLSFSRLLGEHFAGTPLAKHFST